MYQKEFAKTLGITPAYLSMLMTGAAPLTDEIALRIEQATNNEVSIKDIRAMASHASGQIACSIFQPISGNVISKKYGTVATYELQKKIAKRFAETENNDE